MNAKRILSPLIIISSFALIAACGNTSDENMDVKETSAVSESRAIETTVEATAVEATTEQVTEEDTLEIVPFFDLNFHMRKSYGYKCEKDQDHIMITCSDSSFIEASVTELPYKPTLDELDSWYESMAETRECSELSKLEDYDMNYYTYTPKTIEGVCHVYDFAIGNLAYDIQVYEKPDTGIVYQNLDEIMINIKQALLDNKARQE